MPRRPLALAFAGAALVVALYVVYAGYTCGARRSTEECFSAEECLAESECVSSIHPFAPAYALASLGALAAAWRREAVVPLLLGVLGAGFGTLAGFSLGLWGIGISLLLVACGIALAPRHPAAWGALVAAMAPFPLLLLAAQLSVSSTLFWAATLLPTVAWLALAFWSEKKKRNELPR